MKIDFDYQIVDENDKAVPDVDGSPVKIATLLKRAVLADANIDGTSIKSEEKLERYELFLKLRQADKDTDFSLAEVTLLDSAVRVYSTLILGQLHYLLNNKTP